MARAGLSMTVPTYLRIHSCGVAPCRPCLPLDHPSQDPLGTEGEAQYMAQQVQEAFCIPLMAPMPSDLVKETNLAPSRVQALSHSCPLGVLLMQLHSGALSLRLPRCWMPGWLEQAPRNQAKEQIQRRKQLAKGHPAP